MLLAAEVLPAQTVLDSGRAREIRHVRLRGTGALKMEARLGIGVDNSFSVGADALGS
jgi:hypothetical protein